MAVNLSSESRLLRKEKRAQARAQRQIHQSLPMQGALIV